MKPAPVCLFTYNRLEETQQTIARLQENYLASESTLYIFSDGPKSDADAFSVERVRDYLKSVGGFKEVRLQMSDSNKGLAASIINGVSHVLHEHEMVIVMEDDLVTAPNFLDFMNQALYFYKQDPQIISVSGYTLNLPSLPGRKDFYFGYRASSWGWGTWKDRWEQVDWEVKGYADFINNRNRRKLFNRGGSDLSGMLRNQMRGKIDSWAIRFCFHQFREDLKTVFPTKSKLENIGFGKDATHTSGSRRFGTPLDRSGKREFEFEHFKQMDEQLVREFASKFSIWERALDKLRKRI